MGLWERWRYPNGVAWEGGALVSATQEANPPYASPLSTLSDCMLLARDASKALKASIARPDALMKFGC